MPNRIIPGLRRQSEVYSQNRLSKSLSRSRFTKNQSVRGSPRINLKRAPSPIDKPIYYEYYSLIKIKARFIPSAQYSGSRANRSTLLLQLPTDSPPSSTSLGINLHMKRVTTSVLLAFGIVLSSAGAAFAEEFLNGANIQVGESGTRASFSTAGQTGVNPRGSFGFTLPADVNNTAAFNAQGGVQRGSGRTGGSFANSQGDTGRQSGRDSDRTNTKFQGNSRKTRTQNQALFETTRNNVLSTNSFDQSNFPSGRFNYGFTTGAGAYAGTASGLFTRGWFLQPTSLGSVDIDTVDR